MRKTLRIIMTALWHKLNYKITYLLRRAFESLVASHCWRKRRKDLIRNIVLIIN